MACFKGTTLMTLMMLMMLTSGVRPSVCAVGVLFGTQCVTGLLAGAIASGVQMAISASNT